MTISSTPASKTWISPVLEELPMDLTAIATNFRRGGDGGRFSFVSRS